MDLAEKTLCENRHPWELSRARCVFGIVKKYPLHAIADIGAGDCFFLQKLLPLVSGMVYAIDAGYGEKAEIKDGIHCLNDISELPKLPGNSAIVMMDVLEHIDDDVSFLNEVLQKISKDDYLFITVPAFQFLFSNHDVFLKHRRRYSRKQLLALLYSCNLKVEKCHYFYSSLFFARWASLLLKKGKPADNQTGIGEWRFGERHIVTRIIYAVLNIDFCVCAFLAKLHICLPGLSVLAVCRKLGG